MSVTTATIRLRPPGTSTTGRCYTRVRSHQPVQNQTQPSQTYPKRSSLSQHHHNHKLGVDGHMPDESLPDQELIRADELPAPPAQFDQGAPREIPEQFRGTGYIH